MTTLPHCPGWGDGPDDWLEECHDCQRKTADGETQPPPAIIVFERENYVPPGLHVAHNLPNATPSVRQSV